MQAATVDRIPPIERLPPEIVSQIFFFAQREDRESVERHRLRVGEGSEVTVSQTSGHWRSVALATPLLWSRIISWPWDSARTDSEVRRIATYLDRSATCPLNIDADVECDEVLDLLCAPNNLVRWRRVHLYFTRPLFVERLFSLLRHASVPLLEHFSFDPDTFVSDELSNIFAGGAPTLHTIRFLSTAIRYVRPPMNAVTTLVLKSSSNKIPYASLRDLIAAIPALVQLSLFAPMHPWPPEAEQTPFNLPFLRTLRIHTDPDVVYQLLSAIDAPDLTFLVLANCIDPDVPDAPEPADPPPTSWSAFISESPKFPLLDDLTLIDCSFTYANCQSLYRALPTITRLSVLGESYPEILKGLSDDGRCESRADLPWQSLHMLTIENLVEESILCTALGVRKRLGRPISILRLNGKLRTRLQWKGHLGWIKTVVTIEPWTRPRWPFGTDVVDVHDIY